MSPQAGCRRGGVSGGVGGERAVAHASCVSTGWVRVLSGVVGCSGGLLARLRSSSSKETSCSPLRLRFVLMEGRSGPLALRREGSLPTRMGGDSSLLENPSSVEASNAVRQLARAGLVSAMAVDKSTTAEVGMLRVGAGVDGKASFIGGPGDTASSCAGNN